jgi:phosphoglycolate phosphatase
MLFPKNPTFQDVYPHVNRPKAILFDWDNTLTVGTLHFYRMALDKTCEQLGLPLLSEYEWHQLPHVSARDVMGLLFPNHPEAFGIMDGHFKKYYMSADPMGGAFELLEFLKKTKVFLGVVSNKTGDILREDVKTLDWCHYFDVVVGSRDFHEDKPSPVPALGALKPSGIPPSKDVWFVGDSEVDLQCAQNCGFQPVIIGEAKIGFSKGVCFKGALHFDSCADLQAHLKGYF